MSAEKPTKTGGRTRAARKRPAAEIEMPVDVAPASDLAVPAPVAAPIADRELTREEVEAEIRRRAYELYLSRNGESGDDLTDWLEAERMVRSSQTFDDGNATQDNRT